jgi:hypothetical protein
MNIKQLIKIIKADTKKFLKSKDGKNYVKLTKQTNLIYVKHYNVDELIYVKGVK